VDAALATGKPAPCSVEMRGRTCFGGVVGFFWVDVHFCFSGTRFYSTWRDISATKKAQARARARVRAHACLHLQHQSPLVRYHFLSHTRTCAAAAAACLQRCLHDFLNTTSHDARTPLTSIQVASQLLSQSDSLTDDALDLVTAIAASARVLLTIVHNVMLKKRLDSGATALAQRSAARGACAAPAHACLGFSFSRCVHLRARVRRRV
jgi:signal transduction histidine kinase